MAITFNPKEAIAFIAKTIVTAYSLSNGATPEQAEIAGGMVSVVAKGISSHSKDKALSQKLSDTIKQAIDEVIIDNPPNTFYEVPRDCEEHLLQAFSFENALNYLASSDPLGEITKTIIMACSKSVDCDLETLPIDKIASELLKRINDAIFSNHELTSLVTSANIIELNKKFDVLIQASSYTSKQETSGDALRDYLSEVLHQKRDKHPSFKLMESIRRFVPNGRLNGKGTERPVWDLIKESWDAPENHSVVIEGDGGIGKTVTLFSVPEQDSGQPEIPAIYVPLFDLVDENGKCLNLTDYIKIWNPGRAEAICNLAEQAWHGPSLLILLDGLNEVPSDNLADILKSLKDWNDTHPSAQYIAVSRPIIGFDLATCLDEKAVSIEVSKLKKDDVRSILDECNLDNTLPPQNSTTWDFLVVPLFLTLYIKGSILNRTAACNYNLAPKETDGPGGIIWNYLQRELLRIRSEKWVIRCAIACEYVLPRVAFEMTKDNQNTIGEGVLKTLIEDAIGSVRPESLPSHLGELYDLYNSRHPGKYPTLEQYDWMDIIIKESGLISEYKDNLEKKPRHKEKRYEFIHQHFRDCLAGIYLVNQAEIAREDEFPEIWGRSQNHLSLKYAAELMDVDTADKLWKVNLDKQQYEKPGYEENRTATCNLLELQKQRMPMPTELDFSGMDLQRLSLTQYMGKDKTDLKLFRKAHLTQHTKLDRGTFQSKGHTGTITCTAVLADGCVVSGTVDHTLRVWNPVTGECQKTLEGHTDSVNCVAVLSDGRVVSGSNDHTLRVWNPVTGKCQQTLEGHTDSVNCLAVLSDGQVVSGSNDHTLRVWNPATGEHQKTLKGHTDSVNCVAVLSDGHVVSGSEDSTLRVWDAVSGQCLRTLTEHKASISCVAALPNGGVVSGSKDSTLRVWNTATGKCQQPFEGHTDSVNCVIILKNGTVVSGSEDSTLRVWDVTSGQCLRTLTGHKASISCVAALPDGEVISGSKDSTLRVWNTATGNCQQPLKGHTMPVRCLAVLLPDGRVVSGSEDSTLRVWNISKNQCLHSLQGRTGDINCVAVLTDRYVVSGANDRILRVWDIGKCQCLRFLKGHESPINCVAVLPNRKVVSGSLDGTLLLWDFDRGELPQTLGKLDSSIRCVADLTDGCVVTGSDDCILRVWDIGTSECIKNLPGHESPINCVAVLPNRKVVSGSLDGTLLLWDIDRGDCPQTLGKLDSPIRCVAALSDGRVVSGSGGLLGDNTLQVWDVTKGKGECLNTRDMHDSQIRCIAAQPDERVVIGFWDGTLQIWDVGTNQCIPFKERHNSVINCVTFLPDGQVISGSDDSTLRVWKADSGELQKTIEVMEIDVSEMRFSSDADLTEDLKRLLRQNGCKDFDDDDDSCVIAT